MVTGKMVGAAVKRVEDPRFLVGDGRYVSVMKHPNTLDMAIVRSPYPHARIRGIDSTAALALPGVIAVFTGADIKGKILPLRTELDNPGYKACDWPVVAFDKVRYVGEPVACVIAESRYIAEDGADLVEVDFDPLPVLVDPEKAIVDKENLIHEEIGTNVHCYTEDTTGDPEGEFAKAHTVVSGRFKTNRQSGLPLEPRGCIADYDHSKGEINFWSSTQMHHMVRTKLSEHLQYPENKIRVIAPDVGGGFGLKSHFFLEEPLTAFASLQLRRPVRWLEDRQESFVASTHAKEQIFEGELAVNEDGSIRAAKVRAIADVGAYGAYPWTSAFECIHSTQMFPGPYRMEHYSFTATSVMTNKTSSSVYRGVGAPVGCFAIERLLDLAGKELGVDPLEMRRRNLIRSDEFPYTSVTGMQYEAGGYLECLEKAAEIINYEDFRGEQEKLRDQGVYRGIGISNYNEITGLGSSFFYAAGMPMSSYESSNIRLDPSGHATLYCGTHSHGQAHETVYAQIASDELGIPMEKITVRLGDTQDSPYGWGTWGSRAAVSGGGAVITTARELAAKVRRVAGHYLEVAADDIELVDDHARVKGAPTRQMSIADLARKAIYTAAANLPENEEPGLEATHYYDTPPVTFPNATHIALVEVDIETGALKVLRYSVVEDCGRIINPMVVDGQISGGVAQGLGGALLEHLVYDEDGQMLTKSLMDYLVPSATELPAIEIGHVQTPSPLTTGGFKGAGEGGAIAPWAALANAVADALSPFGHNVNQLPLSPELVHKYSQRTN